MNKYPADTRSASEMPGADMSGLTGQPGVVVTEMPAGPMTSEAAMTSTAMYEGQPGVERDMPGGFPAAVSGVQEGMPARTMLDGRPGIESDMPTGRLDVASTLGAEAANAQPSEQPALEITGKWQLTFWVSEVKRNKTS